MAGSGGGGLMRQGFKGGDQWRFKKPVPRALQEAGSSGALKGGSALLVRGGGRGIGRSRMRAAAGSRRG